MHKADLESDFKHHKNCPEMFSKFSRRKRKAFLNGSSHHENILVSDVRNDKEQFSESWVTL